jgi:two-component system, NarL family, invasion response regulator UvrY
MPKSGKCLIVDDHPIIRKGIRDLLMEERAYATIAEAGNATDALLEVRKQPWDLLILDIGLPDKHGLEVLKEVKRIRPELPVLMLSLYPEREFALRSFRAGAAGYVTKDQVPAELLTAVREVTAGRRYITHTLADQIASFIDRGQSEPTHHILSDREMEVLRLLGQGKTVSVIAKAMALSVKTISTYRGRVLDKLQLRTTADLVRYAVEHHLTT